MFYKDRNRSLKEEIELHTFEKTEYLNSFGVNTSFLPRSKNKQNQNKQAKNNNTNSLSKQNLFQCFVLMVFVCFLCTNMGIYLYV